MSQRKLAIFVETIDNALFLIKKHLVLMRTIEFYQKLKEANWITEEDVHLGRIHLEKKYPHIFDYDFLEDFIVNNLKLIKHQAENGLLEKDIKKYPIRGRPSFGFTRGISDRGHEMWGDELYDFKIYDACGAVEDYYNKELE